MTKRVWNWNNFRGGLSDNPFLGQEGQFQDGYNIDVQTEPNGFKLVSDFNSTLMTASAPNVIIDLADYGSSGIYTFCAGGEIYKDASTTPIYTDVTGSEIKAATAMWVSATLYIYYFTGIGTIHRINTDGTGHTTKGTLTGSSVYPIVKYGGDIYLGDKNAFKKLDSAETLTTIFTASVENTFTAITFFQDSFNLYSRLGDATNPRDGQQFIIKVNATSPSYITKWDRLPILGACNQGAIDYVVTGSGPNYSDLYMVSGTQRQLIKSNYEGMAYGRKFNGKIISWKDEVFLLGWNHETASSVNAKSIFRLGKYFPGMPQAITEIFRGDEGWEIYSIMAGYNNLYFGKKGTGGFYTNSNINLDTPVTSAYQTNGYIVSLVYPGESPTIMKTIDEIDISYMCDATNPYFPHGGTITLYGRVKPGDPFTQLGGAYTRTDIGNIKITAPEIGLDNFYQLELKCAITRGSASLSPLVTGIKVYYDDNINS